MVCRDGMVECTPGGETTTATTRGEARDGTTARYLTAMFEPTGKAGKAVAIGGINRIEARPGATVREWRTVGTSEALDRRQGVHRLRRLLARLLRKQGVHRLQRLLARLLILVRTEVLLGAWGEEAMHEYRATVVPRAARACLQKEQAVWAEAMWVVAAGARAMPSVPVKG